MAGTFPPASLAVRRAFSLLDRAAGQDPLPWNERFRKQKRQLRQAGEQRLAARLARPRGAWPCPAENLSGRFEHRAYGSLRVTANAAHAWMFGPDEPQAPCVFKRVEAP